MNALDCAKKIVKQLNEAGYTAYFAGGWVRDFLMGHPSSDIDIATNAPPETIVKLFPKTVPVGISFGVVIVLMDGHQFEVSTFRRDLEYQDGRRPTEIELSTPVEDAQRRDFTINGMFYDPVEEKVIDYVKGQEDLKRGVVRTIGNPHERFVEDRLRMIRAVRFAERFGFTIDEETRKAIAENAKTLFPAVAIERVWQELEKMAEYPNFAQAIVELHQLGLLSVIFPVFKTIDVEELKRRVSSFANFPKESPPILYVMELFPDASLETQSELCQYLKVSNKNSRLVEFTCRARELVQKEESEDVEWARYYAQPNAQLSLEVIAARYPSDKRATFLSKHKERQKRLDAHIQRIASRQPLVTSLDLQQEGIPPSKKMGELLEEAERISVNQDLHDKEQVLTVLKQSPKWPH
ncbi:MAG: CCA-adding enzyme [Chlamydiae bacterium]|nr:CCA-adding enzyme [Chlamydiota bacterium]